MSAFWGAVSGLLFVYYNKYIHPASLSLQTSAEGLLAVIAGGSGTLERTARRRGDRAAAQELRLGLHRALEHAARVRVPGHRDLHAGRRGSRRGPAVGAVERHWQEIRSCRDRSGEAPDKRAPSKHERPLQ